MHPPRSASAVAAALVPSTLMAMLLLATSVTTSCKEAGRAERVGGSGPIFGGPDLAPGIEACTQEGEVRSCRASVTAHAGVLHCHQGVQECRNGYWGACAGSDVTVKSFFAAGAPGSLSTKSISMPSQDAQACKDDPCNPECVGFEEPCRTDAGGDGGCTATLSSGAILGHAGYGNSPAGFQAKQTCGRSGGGCATGYPKKCTGEDHYNKYDGCLSDHHCDDVTGDCERNALGWSWPASVCNGPDLTIGASCTPDDGATHVFPVCNRGSAPIPAGAVLTALLSNPKGFALDSCASEPDLGPGGRKSSCSRTLAAPLAPGACIMFGDAAALGRCEWSNGNWIARITADASFTECATIGCSDNWSDIKKGSPCVSFSSLEPMVIEEEYVATCALGEIASWDRLEFEASTPCAGTDCSTLTFEARTLAADGTPAPASPVVLARAPASAAAPAYPPICRAGVADCPVDVVAPLGGAATAANTRLQLKITLSPNAAKSQVPTLRSWQLTYRCKAAE